ncbi:MAG: polyprenyl synthetase family protein [Desulfobacterales bacterium]
MDSSLKNPDIFNLKTYLKHQKVLVENCLEQVLNNYSQKSRVVSALRYCLMSGGKRIRPVLCIAAWEAMDPAVESFEDVLMCSCALEMVHTYSLIHDDLPAMDNDELRRGMPTCHVAFDEATAILAGDALLTMAFETLSFAANQGGKNPDRWLEVIEIIARSSGASGMVEGQMQDIFSEGIPLSLESLKNMHHLKTGALIEASVCSGAILAGAEPHQIDSMKTYARHIGLAFQVADDILNVEGDPALLGKATGTDSRRNKNTYPSLLGLAESKAFARKIVESALQSLSDFDIKSDPLRAIARYIIDRKK